MMDCKKALQHEGVDGNLEKAVEVLRKQGMKRVNKVSSRTTTQGVIASVVTEKRGVMVEVRLETRLKNSSLVKQILLLEMKCSRKLLVTSPKWCLIRALPMWRILKSRFYQVVSLLMIV